VQVCQPCAAQPSHAGRGRLAVQALVADYAANKAIVDESSAGAAVADVTAE